MVVAPPKAVTAPTAIPSGARISGYRVGEQLGRGGMGVVYRAHHIALDRPAALKVLAPELAQNDEFRERFIRESRTAAALRHPNVVAVYDAGDNDGLLYLAMQLVEGTDLKHRLDEDGTPTADDTVAILFQVAEALEAAHAMGLVHRDVKPANVLLDGDHAYLGDFGLSKRLASRGGLTAAGAMLGTIDYVAPEQIQGGEVDARTDVYALGCVAYECLSGTPPFAKATDIAILFAHVSEQARPLTELRSDIPARVDLPLGRAMAKAPERRYSRPSEFVVDLAAELGVEIRDSSARTSRATVAVISPEPTTCVLVRGSLAALPIHVEELPAAACDTKAAEFDVVIVDSALGRDAAVALIAGLDAQAGTASERPRVLALTDRGAGASELEPLRRAADAVLGKPFSGLQLASRMRQLIGEDVLAG